MVKGIDEPKVSDWLAGHCEGLQPPLRFEAITGGHSNLTYKVTDATGRNVVLRRPPLGAVLATAHDMGREHRIIRALAGTGVPVPPALALCSDEGVNGAPFYVMDFVQGTVLDAPGVVRSVLPDHASRLRLSHSVLDALVALHTLDPEKVGLGDLGRREAYLDRQLGRWRTQWEKSKTRELAAMDETFELLVKAKPEQKYTGIVHGDYRLGNMLSTGDGKVAAVLDWELSTIGHPIVGDEFYGMLGALKPDRELPQPGRPAPLPISPYIDRQALHATEISFAHPITHEWQTFTAPMPDDLERAIDLVRGL